MREADNKYVFLSVVGVYVVRTSSLNDKHSCQLFRKATSFPSLVLLSSSISTANLSCLLETTFSSLRFLFNFTSLQSFESGQAWRPYQLFDSIMLSEKYPLYFFKKFRLWLIVVLNANPTSKGCCRSITFVVYYIIKRFTHYYYIKINPIYIFYWWRYFRIETYWKIIITTTSTKSLKKCKLNICCYIFMN